VPACFILALLANLTPAPAAAQASVTLDETYTLFELNHSVSTVDANHPDHVTYKPELRLRFYGAVPESSPHQRIHVFSRHLA